MTSATAYALAAMLLFGLSDLAYKQAAAAGLKAHHFLMVQTWFFFTTVLAYGIATECPGPHRPAWLRDRRADRDRLSR